MLSCVLALGCQVDDSSDSLEYRMGSTGSMSTSTSASATASAAGSDESSSSGTSDSSTGTVGTASTDYESEVAMLDYWCYEGGECHCWQIIYCHESNDCSDADPDRHSQGACATTQYTSRRQCYYGDENGSISCPEWCDTFPGTCWANACTTAEDC